MKCRQEEKLPPADNNPKKKEKTMDKNKTEIVLVIDKSGSMHSLQKTVVESVNSFLEEQAGQPGTAYVTLYSFDNEVQEMLRHCELKEVPKLTEKNYVPGGMTALLDGVGRAIDETGARLAALPEEERPAVVTVGIMTDGYENASREYSRKDIAERIARQKEKYNWKFIFFGAGEDAIQVAAQMNIDKEDSVKWEAGNAEDLQAVMHCTSQRVSYSRKCSIMGVAEDRVSMDGLMDRARSLFRKKRK